jgi:hypothetical protein
VLLLIDIREDSLTPDSPLYWVLALNPNGKQSDYCGPLSRSTGRVVALLLSIPAPSIGSNPHFMVALLILSYLHDSRLFRVEGHVVVLFGSTMRTWETMVR